MAIRIEVCERMMDHTHRPVFNEERREYVMREFPRYHAQIATKPGVWAAGNSIDDASAILFDAILKILGWRLSSWAAWQDKWNSAFRVPSLRRER